jgi:hypothetical protein
LVISLVSEQWILFRQAMDGWGLVNVSRASFLSFSVSKNPDHDICL